MPNSRHSAHRHARPTEPAVTVEWVPFPPFPSVPSGEAPAGPAPVASGPGGFAELGVAVPLVKVLAGKGITTPFPIQAATLTDSLAGRDVLGRGRTGSGKTVAFALPVVTALSSSTTPVQPGRPRALILLPTRELAAQVAATISPLAKAVHLTTTVIFGGVSQHPQVKALAGGVDIVVACPGRLEDLIKQGHCHLDAVEVTVLDEADHMADLGFLPVVRRILDRTPDRHQRLLFSATLDGGIDSLVRQYLNNPAVHSVDPPEASPAAVMDHHVLHVADEDKAAVVTELASGEGRAVLFTRTKHRARRIARQLTSAGIPAVDLHGNLSQVARERNLTAFSSGKVRVMVATDIAARGIHVDDVTLVVHVDPPAEHKAYVHRSGRTARAGAAGAVVTVVTPDQQSDMRDLARSAGIRPRTTSVTPGHAHIVMLTGPPAPKVTPVVAPASVAETPRPTRAPSRSGRRR